VYFGQYNKKLMTAVLTEIIQIFQTIVPPVLRALLPQNFNIAKGWLTNPLRWNDAQGNDAQTSGHPVDWQTLPL